MSSSVEPPLSATARSSGAFDQADGFLSFALPAARRAPLGRDRLTLPRLRTGVGE